jgi:YidC/Oxa1 family membrane protein insertase
MEGQGKRLLLAVVLALGVYMLWMVVFPPEAPQPPPQQDPNAAVATKVVAQSGVQYCPEEEPSVEVPRPSPVLTELAFPQLSATFSTHDGALVSWRLADKRFEKDATRGELLPSEGDRGAFHVGFWRSSNRCLPRHQVWTLASKTDTQVVYEYAYEGITFTKTYDLLPETYMVRMTLATRVDAKEPVVVRPTITVYAFQDPKADAEGGMQVAPRVWVSATSRDGEVLNTPLKDLQDGEQGIPQPRFETGISWAGYEHPYLLSAYAPRRLANEPVAKHTYPLEPYGSMRTDIEFPPATFVDGKAEHVVVGYLGPKNYNILKNADERAGFTEPFVESEFLATIDLGWFAFIGRPLMWLLHKFYGLVGNWAIAIVLLTFLVKGLTLYWTTKSMRSMKQMAALAPQMKALQEKYKNDRQRIQAETMALYKQHNVNPIAGCLPILLQMPIWIALYRMLSSAGELYQQPFIPGWIDDLTDTDPFHILPIILVVTMFAQARLTPSTGDSRQQKFLQYGMPLMFGVMSFFFPAGLTLYIFTNTVLGALHSIYMNKYDKKSIAIAAQLKKNAEAAAAEKEAAAGKKPDAKPGAKKPIIDVASDDKGETAEPAPPTRPAGPPRQQRPRNKKKRKR